MALGDEAVGTHLVTELQGSEQQEGPSGGAVYSPVDRVQGLRPQKPVLHVSEQVWVQQQVPVQLQGFLKSFLGPAPVGRSGSAGSVL